MYICVCVCICVCLCVRVVVIFSLIIFTNPSARAGYDTRLIFKQSFLLLD